MFAVSGEYLTMRIRGLAFKSYLRQEIGYFDEHKNNVGAVTTRLATDASAVQGVSLNFYWHVLLSNANKKERRRITLR